MYRFGFQTVIETEDAQGRLRNRLPTAVVDIGSNSVRLVIYEGLVRAPSVLFNEKVQCGLGRGIAETGNMDEEAVDAALAALHRFKALAFQARVERLYVLATAAAREAPDGICVGAMMWQLSSLTCAKQFCGSMGWCETNGTS